jgi:hypothetical protein
MNYQYLEPEAMKDQHLQLVEELLLGTKLLWYFFLDFLFLHNIKGISYVPCMEKRDYIKHLPFLVPLKGTLGYFFL